MLVETNNVNTMISYQDHRTKFKVAERTGALFISHGLSGFILQGLCKVCQEYYGTQLTIMLFLGSMCTYILIDIIT